MLGGPLRWVPSAAPQQDRCELPFLRTTCSDLGYYTAMSRGAQGSSTVAIGVGALITLCRCEGIRTQRSALFLTRKTSY